MDTYQIYDGTDENGIVDTLAPGLDILFYRVGQVRGTQRMNAVVLVTTFSYGL